MTLYADIVPTEDIEHERGVAYVKKEHAKRYEPLSSIERPANNGVGLSGAERITLVYTDGQTETVEGHLLNTGDVE